MSFESEHPARAAAGIALPAVLFGLLGAYVGKSVAKKPTTGAIVGAASGVMLTSYMIFDFGNGWFSDSKQVGTNAPPRFQPRFP